ncbi:MAG: hypothetical protein JG777_2848 [Clostridia bacterium]|jgi:hypothetical protein|nr:hypothetical protein [Clostridia bacterium]
MVSNVTYHYANIIKLIKVWGGRNDSGKARYYRYVFAKQIQI